MRITSFIVAFVALVALAGCRSKDAFQFSEDIVGIERKLGESLMEAQPKILRYMQESIFDSLSLVGGQMVAETDKSIESIKALKAPSVKEADAFKAASLRYFGHIRDIYDSYRKYADQPNDSLRSEELERMVALEEDIDTHVKDMQDAQQKFAKANGFRVDKDK
jgi:hypothetical protein